MAESIIVQCGICGDKFVSFMDAWKEHNHDGRKDWRVCEETVVKVPKVSSPLPAHIARRRFHAGLDF